MCLPTWVHGPAQSAPAAAATRGQFSIGHQPQPLLSVLKLCAHHESVTPAALDVHCFLEKGLEPVTAQVSVWLHVTTRWRLKLKDWLGAGGGGTQGGRRGFPLLVWPPAPGPGLAAPSLGTDIDTFHFSDSLYQRIQGPGPGEALPLQ